MADMWVIATLKIQRNFAFTEETQRLIYIAQVLTANYWGNQDLGCGMTTWEVVTHFGVNIITPLCLLVTLDKGITVLHGFIHCFMLKWTTQSENV